MPVEAGFPEPATARDVALPPQAQTAKPRPIVLFVDSFAWRAAATRPDEGSWRPTERIGTTLTRVDAVDVNTLVSTIFRNGFSRRT